MSRPPRLDRRQLFSLLAVTAVAGCSGGGDDAQRATGTSSATPGATPSPQAPTTGMGAVDPQVAGTVATGITTPWGLTFLASGDALVSERDSGRIIRVSPDGEKKRVGVVDGVTDDTSEGGLLGITLSPDQSELYAYYTAAGDNRVVRMSVAGDSLGRPKDVVTGIPRNSFHNGGRLRFGPDGQLYVSTGDAGAEDDAQDRDALAGKILRLTPGGKPSDGNPFDNEVFSYGHRNVQGLAFDDAGRLWASEFGNKRRDELNLVTAGENYGWPRVEGTADDDRFADPQVTWATDNCSPSGIAITRSTVLVAGLKGESLYAVPVEGATTTEPKRLFEGEYGRLRTIEPAPDGSLWLTTSNTDGRADPGRDDDKILRITV